MQNEVYCWKLDSRFACTLILPEGCIIGATLTGPQVHDHKYQTQYFEYLELLELLRN